MENIKELNLNQMELVDGGKGGSKEKLPDKSGYKTYQIQHGDTLIKNRQPVRDIRR